MASTRDALAGELGAPLPAEFATLNEDELARLRELLAATRERQSSALRNAMEDGLGFVPRVVRGAVRRALFG